jgi:hypothetical protein
VLGVLCGWEIEMMTAAVMKHKKHWRALCEVSCSCTNPFDLTLSFFFLLAAG